MLDGWQGSKELPPSMRYEPLCKATQQMKSRNRQANGWQTSRLIPKHGHILLHWVFLRLKVQIEDEILPCLFLFGPFLCLCSGCSPCLHLYLAGKSESHTSESLRCLLTSLSCLSFLSTTKQSPLVTTIQDLVLVLRQRMLFRSSWICLYLFPIPFPFLLFTWRPLYRLHFQAYSLSSHVQKHYLSSSMQPCSPVTSSVAHCPKSSSAQFSTIKVLLMLLPYPLTRE